MDFIMTGALVICLISMLVTEGNGHGYLKEPPSRSSMWRYGFSTPRNYDDNQLFCGGYDVQWNKNSGKCGICGDRWDGSRDNEAGGKYATGIISRHYNEGQAMHVEVKLTVQHGGYFEFRICPNNNPNRKATQECLDRYLLRQPDGSTRYYPKGGSKTYNVQLMVPSGLTCTQCVFQWIWNTASNWGCKGGQCGKGFGPQEQFRGCSDVSISSSGSSQSSNSIITGTQHNIAQNVQSGTNMQNVNNIIPANNNHSPSGKQNTLLSILGQSWNSIGTNQETCQATDRYRAQYPYADQYCLNQCKSGRCLSSYFCNEACKKLSEAAKIQQPACEATIQFKAMYPNANEYCRTICKSGQCPAQYCTAACRNA